MGLHAGLNPHIDPIFSLNPNFWPLPSFWCNHNDETNQTVMAIAKIPNRFVSYPRPPNWKIKRYKLYKKFYIFLLQLYRHF